MKKLILSLVTFCVLACGNNAYQNFTQKQADEAQEGLPFSMPQIIVPNVSNSTYNVVDFGADNTGVNLCTEAIQSAIDAANEAGGGTVVIPAGVYSTGPIVLKSNVRLFTEHNSLIFFSDDFDLYPIIETSFEGVNTKRCQSPVSAFRAENIAICGYGTFNGSGDGWRPLKKDKVSERQWRDHIKQYGGYVSADGRIWYPTEGALYASTICKDQNVPEPENDSVWEYIRGFLRPVMLHFVECKNILLEGVTFDNSPAWNIHPLMCENVILSNLSIRNPWYCQNGDGVDIESCKNVLIQHCSFDVGDDAICMKSGKNEDGRKRGIPTENVIVQNNVVYNGHGGFVVGSEMSGNIRNIKVSNCLFVGTEVGLRFKSTRGRGGVVENIYIDNINMRNITTDALLFDLFYGGKSAVEQAEEEPAKLKDVTSYPVTVETPQFRNIFISDCICQGARRAMYFNGLPEMPIENVSLKNMHLFSTNPAEFHQVVGLSMENVVVNGETLCAE